MIYSKGESYNGDEGYIAKLVFLNETRSHPSYLKSRMGPSNNFQFPADLPY